MSVYQQVLDVAREQAAAVHRGELQAATKLLEQREHLLAGAQGPTADEVPLVRQILTLDRALSSAIRERMIEIRNESLLAAAPAARLTAVDLNPTMNVVARARLAPAIRQDRVEVIESSILHVDLPSDEFDFALLRLVLQHVAAPDLALMECARLLA